MVTSFYSNLVTRPTGRAVRMGVESQLAELDGIENLCLSVLDFSQVPVMDGNVCIGSVAESQLTTASLADPRVLDKSVGDVMDQPFPVVDDDQPVENVAKLLSKSNRAVLLRHKGVVQGIVTRFDVLEYLMHR